MLTGARGRACLIVAFVVGGAVATFTMPGHAHPLGNFSISHYSRLELRGETIEVRYVVDMAEIPTFQELQELQETGLVAETTHPRVPTYLARKAETLKDGLALAVNGSRVSLETVATTVIFPPGAGGLPTLKLGIRYRAKPPRGDTDLSIDYHDNNFIGRAGWKEIVAVAGAGLELVESSVPAQDRSQELSDYPTDLLNSPPQTINAYVVARRRDTASAATLLPPPPSSTPPPRASTKPPEPGATEGRMTVGHDVVATPSEVDDMVGVTPNRQAAPPSRFTELVATPQLGIGIVLFALIAAGGLGAFHALEPGHGKTLVAAYLVGSRGTAWHALVLGLVVTASHTAGVYFLGAVTLYASRYVLPERLYPWLGVASGLLIAGLGLALFLRRYVEGPIHPHAHDHLHDHADHTHAADGGVVGHVHAHHHHHHGPDGEVSLRTLFALGVTGGIVPCPAALVVLLSAISLNRVAFGLVLIVAFSLGLAAVLIAIGLLIVYARTVMTRFHSDGRMLTRWLPITSSAVMTALGVGIALRSLSAAGVIGVS